jgi:hypothetical protein
MIKAGIMIKMNVRIFIWVLLMKMCVCYLEMSIGRITVEISIIKPLAEGLLRRRLEPGLMTSPGC